MAQRYPVISVTVGGQDCGAGYDAKDLEVIGRAFTTAANAVRKRKRGEVFSSMSDGGQLVAVAIDDPKKEFDPDTFPVISEIKRR